MHIYITHINSHWSTKVQCCDDECELMLTIKMGNWWQLSYYLYFNLKLIVERYQFRVTYKKVEIKEKPKKKSVKKVPVKVNCVFNAHHFRALISNDAIKAISMIYNVAMISASMDLFCIFILTQWHAQTLHNFFLLLYDILL